jgi:D-sedoheptulose 7-phosphate isomerase
MLHAIEDYLDHLKLVLEQLDRERIRDLVGILTVVRESGNHVFFMGNGGSGSTASHFATDLGKGTAVAGKRRFKVLPLNDHLPTFSAYANDQGYESVFAEQLRAFVERGDVVIGLSASGNSPNVLRAMEVARAAGAIRVGFTGFDGGALRRSVDLNLHAPAHNVGRAEDAHHIVMHLVCEIIRNQPEGQAVVLPDWLVREHWGLRVARHE